VSQDLLSHRKSIRISCTAIKC